jgi:hypothetical protein
MSTANGGEAMFKLQSFVRHAGPPSARAGTPVFVLPGALSHFHFPRFG